jgi:hypothetical protein
VKQIAVQQIAVPQRKPHTAQRRPRALRAAAASLACAGARYQARILAHGERRRSLGGGGGVGERAWGWMCLTLFSVFRTRALDPEVESE